MKVLIELPDHWLDTDKAESLDFIGRQARQEMRSAIVAALTETVLAGIKTPTFSAEEIRAEVKTAIVDRLVDRAIKPHA